jgi:hypothetical protein
LKLLQRGRYEINASRPSSSASFRALSVGDAAGILGKLYEITATFAFGQRTDLETR